MLIVDLPAAVQAADAIVVAITFSDCDQSAQLRGIAKTISIAPDEGRILLLECRRIGAKQLRKEQRCHLVTRNERADGVVASLARQFCGDLRVGDCSGENDIKGRFEIVRTFQEEWPCLGEEQCKAFVDIELRNIRLHLGKIGVDGEVHGHVRRHTPSNGDPAFHFRVARLHRYDARFFGAT